MFQRHIAILLLVAMMTGCATKPVTPLTPGVDAFPQPSGYNQYSVEQEVQLGKEVSAQADAQLPELPTRGPIQDYISTLGQRLARTLPNQGAPFIFNFKVVNQKDINAFALPGGPVRINLGTIQAADTEAQLAGVMAHEISHVWLRHATRNASKQSLWQIPAAIGGAVLGNGAAGQLARLGLQFGVGSVLLKYSRDAESEADRTGAKIMYEAGYDPRAMAQFFEKLKSEDNGSASGGPQFLSDHPDPGNRAEAVTTAISQLPAKQYAQNSPEFRRIKQVAATLKPYTAQQVAQMQQQKQAKIAQAGRQSVMPSGNFTTLNHRVFQMQYPDNWQVFGDQNAAVTIAPQAGVSQDAIAYGVMVNGYQSDGQISLEQATQQVYNMLRQSNQQINAQSQPRQAQVDGAPAYVMDLIGPSPITSQDGQPVAERDLLVVTQRQDGTVIYLLFIAPQQDFSALQPTFERMINSFRMR